jgi:hypothetical protein
MIIVLDTNIWLQNLYLRSPAGAATRFYIFQKKAKLALPEVVRREVEHHLSSDLRSYIDKIQDNHGRLLALFGALKEIVLPNNAAVDEKVSQVFQSLNLDIVEVPFSLESAKSSFLKTIKKQPPSDHGQQFKDGVLWADCLTLLKSDEVVLVTDDKAFFEKREYAQGLSNNLKGECAGLDNQLTLLSKLSDLLEEIKEDITIDKEALIAAFFNRLGTDVDEFIRAQGFERTSKGTAHVTLFATEKSNRLFMDYVLNFVCTDTTDSESSEAVVSIRGDGNYDAASKTFSNLAPLGVELFYTDANGLSHRPSIAYGRIGHIYLGHADVAHSVRQKLN